jgi:hypothetical protein
MHQATQEVKSQEKEEEILTAIHRIRMIAYHLHHQI